MSRGGHREGAGGKPTWKHGKTTNIRVPIALKEKILKIARQLDANEAVDLAKEHKTSSNLDPDSMNFHEDNLTLGQNPSQSFDLPSLPKSNFPNNSSVSQSKDRDMARKIGIEGLYYITHFDNVPSILRWGILSHDLVQKKGINYAQIYNSNIVNNRSQRNIQGKSLWEFANLYFQPRNAMLYSLKEKKSEIAIICIKRDILKKHKAYIATGNAASRESKIFSIQEGRSYLPKIRDEIDKDWWKIEDGSKRKMMAEFLVPDFVSPKYIQGIYVASDKAREKLEQIIIESEYSDLPDVPISVEPKRFFQPDWKGSLTSTLFLIRGDMFFSTMQTLTISVNCVGVMGKGLASTAKYRFPDLYVKYQDICKSDLLKMGKPYLYKREASIAQQLADEALLSEQEYYSQTWFLLFPTKNHWKNKANLLEIEKGLQWLLENHKRLKIESLAMPALGCGLGELEWRDVGPLMCKYLSAMRIPTAIYLPVNKEVPQEFLSREFLLSKIDF